MSDDDLLEAKKPAAKKGGGQMGGGSGSQKGGIDPNDAIKAVSESYGGKHLIQDVQRHAIDLAIAAGQLAKKFEDAGLDAETAKEAAAKYALQIAQAQMTQGQGKSR